MTGEIDWGLAFRTPGLPSLYTPIRLPASALPHQRLIDKFKPDGSYDAPDRTEDGTVPERSGKIRSLKTYELVDAGTILADRERLISAFTPGRWNSGSP